MRKNIFLFLITIFLLFPFKVNAVVSADNGISDYRQKAIIETALSYYRRYENDNNKIQYNSLYHNGLDVDYAFKDVFENNKSSFAWADYYYSPEAATKNNTLNLTCSAFIFNVYYDAFKYELIPGGGIDSSATSIIDSIDDDNIRVYYEKLSDKTETEKDDIWQEFLEVLVPGDIIVYKVPGGGQSAHTMLYIGNNHIIHSTGTSYDYVNKKDIIESKENKNDAIIFDNITNKRAGEYIYQKYIFETANATAIGIYRPLNDQSYAWDLTDNAKTRMALSGLDIEKYTSYKKYNSVSKSGEITYYIEFNYDITDSNNSYRISSSNESFWYIDSIPENTKYVQGSIKDNDSLDEIKVEDGEIKIKIDFGDTSELKTKGNKIIEYKVKINDDLEESKIISDKGFIKLNESDDYGIYLGVIETFVSSVISDFELDKLNNEIKKDLTYKSNIDFISCLYYETLKIDVSVINNIKEIMFEKDKNYYMMRLYRDALSSKEYRENLSDDEKIISQLLVNGLYGGKKIMSTTTENISKDFKLEYLMQGDIIYYYDGDNSIENYLIYLNNKFLNYNLENNKVQEVDFNYDELRGYDLYAVLRPIQVNNNIVSSNIYIYIIVAMLLLFCISIIIAKNKYKFL